MPKTFTEVNCSCRRHFIPSEVFPTVPWAPTSLWFSSHSFKWKHFCRSKRFPAVNCHPEGHLFKGRRLTFFVGSQTSAWTLTKCRALTLTNSWTSDQVASSKSLQFESHDAWKSNQGGYGPCGDLQPASLLAVLYITLCTFLQLEITFVAYL